MIVTKSMTELRSGIGAVCLGTFDGVHLGHQAIMAEVVKISRQSGKRSAAFTFHPHPSTLTGRGPVSVITTREQRARLMVACGIDVIVEHPFTAEFAGLSPQEFVQSILLKVFGSIPYVAGFNYSFGHKASGTIEILTELGRQYGFNVLRVEPVRVGGEVVSSTRVRKLVQNGELSAVKACLGRHFSLAGTVLHGDGRGRTLGFPTANVHFTAEQVLPPSGVYLLNSSEYGVGVANLGVRPTFPQQGITLEVHFLRQLEQEIYDQHIEVDIIEYLRSEQVFSDGQALRAQVFRDIERAVELSQYLNLLNVPSNAKMGW
ncbi:MAG: riboflavin biosynthesis protein RibF [Peptococcaceae bacterium]|nr:riboflavin biosynthesis protein RibF [Peptococcaceae bacterium]